jgi:hypothetical protein
LKKPVRRNGLFRVQDLNHSSGIPAIETVFPSTAFFEISGSLPGEIKGYFQSECGSFAGLVTMDAQLAPQLFGRKRAAMQAETVAL